MDRSANFRNWTSGRIEAATDKFARWQKTRTESRPLGVTPRSISLSQHVRTPRTSSKFIKTGSFNRRAHYAMKFHHRRNSRPLLPPCSSRDLSREGTRSIHPWWNRLSSRERNRPLDPGQGSSSRSRASRPLRGHLRLICALLGRRIAETSTISNSVPFVSSRKSNEHRGCELKRKLEGIKENRFRKEDATGVINLT